MNNLLQLSRTLISFLALSFLLINASYGQGDEKKASKAWYEKGSVYGKVFANFNTSGSEIGKTNAFAVDRAYFGYKANINENFAANIKLDIGASEELGRRFAFFKNAYLQYSISNFKVQFGIADAFQFKVQEKFWGYRYIYKSFQDQYKFGSSADIGVFTSYKFSDALSADFSISNGDGYGNIQNATTDNLKTSLGTTLKPIDDLLTIRVYGDVMALTSDSAQYTIVGFAGLKFKPFRIGGEYIYQVNNRLNRDYNQNGLSVFSTVYITDKINAFARFDHLASDEIIELTDDTGAPTGEMVSWNSRDGDFIMGGIEYSPIKNVNMALNYRYAILANENEDNLSWLFLNLQVSF